MQLSQHQIDLIQSSLEIVLPMSVTAGDILYKRLFQLDPELKALFADQRDMGEQGDKLMKMIAAAVAMLRDPEKLIPALESLGQRHVAYGVKPKHYDVMGEALLWTMERSLGHRFTREMQDAWAEVYKLMADIARKAAEAV